jgi:hypothetical protein
MLGWSTRRKILVIESDDWGTVRMPSKRAFEKLEKAGLDLRSRDAERYSMYDTLASVSDLSNLFEVLAGFRDIHGRHCVFTPVSIVANPDFKKIRESNFENYHYELFTDSLKKYKGCESSFELWKEGIREGLFVPQLHGREHLNVLAWMRALRSGDRHTRMAFDEGVWSYIPDPEASNPWGYLAAFQLFEPEDIEYQKGVIQEATEIFEKLFGYRAELFVAPNNKYNNSLNGTLLEHGIKFKAAGRKQLESMGSGRERTVYNLRQRSRSGLWYLFRNVFFEPNLEGRDWVDICMKEIDNAFKWKKAAIISSHRTNYIGALDEQNRDRSLELLKSLIKGVQKKWPDVEFKTSAELGRIMTNREK